MFENLGETYAFVIVGLVPTTQTSFCGKLSALDTEPKNWVVGTSPTMTNMGAMQ